MMPPHYLRMSVLVPLFLLLAVAPEIRSVAQEQTPVPGDDPTVIVSVPLELPAGEQTWLAIFRATLADDDPAIPVRPGMVYAFDAPLLLLYDGENRVGRVAPGGAAVLQDGEQVRPLAARTGPASMLAVGLGDPTTPPEPYLPIGEPFSVTADTYTLSLRRIDLTIRPDRELQYLQQMIASLPFPALLYVEQGEITGRPVGQRVSTTLQQHEGMAVDDQAGLDVSDDGAVILLVTLEPTVEPGTVAGGTSPLPSGSSPTPTGSTTPSVTPPPGSTATVEPTLAPTVTPTTAATDTDGDGLSDADEARRGTNPNSRDTDGDGVFDGYEVSVGLDPLKQDTDGDGVSDYDENPEPEQGSGDADGDGLTDGYEDQVSLTNPNDSDSDDDGLNDGDENSRGSNPLDNDSDDDGLTDGDEVSRATNPTNRDSDGDGLGDGFEVGQGTNPLAGDSDADGVDDGYETGRGMNPNAGDSDGDGLGDGAELNTYGTNPTNPDSDGDERSDGYEVNCGQSPTEFTDYTDVVAC